MLIDQAPGVHTAAPLTHQYLSRQMIEHEILDLRLAPEPALQLGTVAKQELKTADAQLGEIAGDLTFFKIKYGRTLLTSLSPPKRNPTKPMLLSSGWRAAILHLVNPNHYRPSWVIWLNQILFVIIACYFQTGGAEDEWLV